MLAFLTHLSWFWRRFWCLQVLHLMTSGRYHWSWGGGGTWVGSSGGRHRGRGFWVNLSSSSTALELSEGPGAAGRWEGSSQTLLWWGWLSGWDALPERRQLGGSFISLCVGLCAACFHNIKMRQWEAAERNCDKLCTDDTRSKTKGCTEWANVEKRFIAKWQPLIALFVGACYSGHFSFFHICFV